jgi:hypothetical protein
MHALHRLGAFALASAGSALSLAQINHAASEAAQVVSPGAAVSAQMSPHLAAISTKAFQAHASTIATVRQQTLTPQHLAKFDTPQRAQLNRSVERLVQANKVFEAKEATMRPKQRLLADLQIELATNSLRKTASVNMTDSATPHVLLLGPDQLSIGAERAALSINKPPLGVDVYVQPNGAKQADAMDVYVLPIGVIEYPVDLEVTQIRNVIDGLMFRNPTSPAHGDLEPGYVYAVWVGSRNAANAMAQLVRDRKVSYHTIDTNDWNGPFTITFDASEQVVAP